MHSLEQPVVAEEVVVEAGIAVERTEASAVPQPWSGSPLSFSIQCLLVTNAAGAHTHTYRESFHNDLHEVG